VVVIVIAKHFDTGYGFQVAGFENATVVATLKQ